MANRNDIARQGKRRWVRQMLKEGERMRKQAVRQYLEDNYPLVVDGRAK